MKQRLAYGHALRPSIDTGGRFEVHRRRPLLLSPCANRPHEPDAPVLKLRYFGLVSRCDLLGEGAFEDTPKALQTGWGFHALGDFLEIGLLCGLADREAQAMRALPAPPFFLLLGEIAALQLTRAVPFQVQERHVDEFVPAFDTS